jgi:CheY-like chemotaxis protein
VGARALILVVDDDEDIRARVADVLEGAGHAVACVSDGLAALQWIVAHGRPSLILLDLLMPRMDGEQLVQALHETSAFAGVPKTEDPARVPRQLE